MIPTLRQRRKDDRGNHSISSACGFALSVAVQGHYTMQRKKREMYFFSVWHFSIISFTFTAYCSSFSQIPAFKHTAMHIAVLYLLWRSPVFPFNRFFMLKMKLCFSPISPRLCQKAFRRRKFFFSVG